MGDNPSEQIFRQGSVLKHPKFLLPDGRRTPKFFIILNKNPTDDIIRFILPTSQSNFYNRSPEWIKKSFIVVPAGTVPFFPTDTFIKCTEIHSLKKPILKELYRKRELERLGILPKQFLDQVVDVIRNSFLIEGDIKKSILEHYT